MKEIYRLPSDYKWLTAPVTEASIPITITIFTFLPVSQVHEHHSRREIPWVVGSLRPVSNFRCFCWTVDKGSPTGPWGDNVELKIWTAFGCFSDGSGTKCDQIYHDIHIFNKKLEHWKTHDKKKWINPKKKKHEWAWSKSRSSVQASYLKSSSLCTSNALVSRSCFALSKAWSLCASSAFVPLNPPSMIWQCAAKCRNTWGNL